MDRKLSGEFGVMEIDENWRMIGFQEKPEEPKTIPGDPGGILASMGIYVFNTELLVRRLIEDARSESSHDFGKDIIPTMIGKDRVFVFDFRQGDFGGTGYWRDVGTIDAYYEANMDLIAVTPQLNLYDPQWSILTHQSASPPAKTCGLKREGWEQLSIRSSRMAALSAAETSSDRFSHREWRFIVSPRSRIPSS